MKSLISLVILLLSADLYALDYSLAGRWQSPSGTTVEFLKNGSQWMAYSRIKYVDESGRETGQSIEYFYQLAEEPTEVDGELVYLGELETYDSYYGCALENGELKASFLSEERLKVIVPVIKFKRVTIGPSPREVVRREPIYCRGHWGEYICGWQRVRVRVPRGGTSHCEITYRNWQAIVLEKKHEEL